MRVLHIGKFFPPFHGGIENVTADLLEQQNLSGICASALVHQHHTGSGYREEYLRQGWVKRVPILGQAVFVPIAPNFPKYLSKALKQADEPDILHMHMPNMSCFWALFSRKAKNIPWVIHWHSDVLGAAPDWRVKLLYPFYRVFEKALLRRASAVIVTSPSYLESSVPLKLFHHKCHVIPLGIGDIEAVEQSLAPAQGTSVLQLLCIGRLTYYKGHCVLLNALHLAVQSGANVELTIVGQGELQGTLARQVEQLGLSQQVVFKGSVDNDELQKLLTTSDLLCLPSIERTEAFGVVLLEAMRVSKPCLVTDVPGSGMSWVVQDGVTGLVAKASDAESLAEKISWAAQNRDKLREMGRAGRKRFEEHFTIECVAAQIDEVYQQVLTDAAPNKVAE